jgi:putative FmdB family regulatory protein
MPRYEYRCHRCGKNFEVRQKFADAPLSVHEGCGGDVERLISAPTLHFKGSGFYVTDYKRNGTSTSNGASAVSESKSEAKSESQPQTKAETKTETKTKTETPPAPAKAER